MHPVVKKIISFYPWVKKFPLPIGFILLIVGGILPSWLLMTIGAVMIIGRVWEIAYQNQQALLREPVEPTRQLLPEYTATGRHTTTTGSG